MHIYIYRHVYINRRVYSVYVYICALTGTKYSTNPPSHRTRQCPYFTHCAPLTKADAHKGLHRLISKILSNSSHLRYYTSDPYKLGHNSLVYQKGRWVPPIQYWKKKWSHFDLKSWVTGETRFRVIGEYLSEIYSILWVNLIDSQYRVNLTQIFSNY